MKKYNLDLTAATFIILDSNEASMEVKIKLKMSISSIGSKLNGLQFSANNLEWRGVVGGVF